MARPSARDATSVTEASDGFQGCFAAMTGAYAHMIAPGDQTPLIGTGKLRSDMVPWPESHVMAR